MRTITNIKPLGKTVYVNFSDGRFGVRKLENGVWTSHNLSDEELSAARKLALRNGAWQKWTAPRADVATPARTRCPDCGGYHSGPNCGSNLDLPFSLK